MTDDLTPDDVERMARAMAGYLGDDFDLAFIDRADQRVCRAANRTYRDVNMPKRDDYRDAVLAVWEARPR